MKRIWILISFISIACCVLVLNSYAQNSSVGQAQSRRTDAITAAPVLSARGTMLIDPDDYANCTGFLLNRLFLASGDFYLDMREYLSLTGDQVAALRDIRLDFVRDTAELEGELSIALLELEDMFDRGGDEVEDIGMKVDDVYDLEAEYQIARIEALTEAREVLTSDQRKLADNMRRRGLADPANTPRMNGDMRPDR